jgi:hypothetical protein
MNWYRKYDPTVKYYVKVQNKFVSDTVRDGSFLTMYESRASMYSYEDALRLCTIYDQGYLQPVRKEDA